MKITKTAGLKVKVFKDGPEKGIDKRDYEYLRDHNLPIPYFFTLIVGEPGSGKSALIKDMLRNRENRKYHGMFDKVMIFSNSLDDFEDDPDLGPLTHKYNPKELREMYENLPTEKTTKVNVPADLDYYQRRAFIEDIEGQGIWKYKDAVRNDDTYDVIFSRPIQSLMVFDDMTEDVNRLKDVFAKMVQNRRHKHLSIMMVTHWFNRIEKRIRSLADHIIMFEPHNEQEKKVLLEQKGLPMSEEEFKKMCDFIYDEPHNFMYIDFRRMKYHKNFDQLCVSSRCT